MSLFIESICVIDGKPRNLEYHQRRFDKTRLKFFDVDDELNLSEIINSELLNSAGKYKFRIVYGKEIQKIESVPYHIRPVHSVRLIENNEAEYSYKFKDRKIFELMKDAYDCDEIIVVKKGKLTDTSYSNLIFYDGENWITPSTYLLNGTMRQSLLDAGEITEDEINPKDLNRFISFKLINSMLSPEESPELDISIIS